MSLKDKRISLGATPRFKQLQPGEVCTFVNATIPEAFESDWDTGYDKDGKKSIDGKYKWSLYFTLLKHPHSSYSLPKNGMEVKWETVAEVIRLDVLALLKTDDAEYWIDPEYIWTLTRREDGSYKLDG